jgi:hypothetical protein
MKCLNNTPRCMDTPLSTIRLSQCLTTTSPLAIPSASTPACYLSTIQHDRIPPWRAPVKLPHVTYVEILHIPVQGPSPHGKKSHVCPAHGCNGLDFYSQVFYGFSIHQKFFGLAITWFFMAYSSERNFSTFGFIHSKMRNSLGPEEAGLYQDQSCSGC